MHRGKKKRNIVIISLVSIMLCMIVGYAAFRTSLNIEGTSEITSTWDIKITNVTSGKKTGDAENAKAPEWEDTRASMEANLYSKGDAMEYDVTILNNGSLDATLDDIITNKENANQEAVIITFTGYKEGEVLKAGESKIVHVKIAYNPDYNGEETSSEVNIDFEFTQENKDPEQPKTYMLTYNYTYNGGERVDSEGIYLSQGATVDINNKAYKRGWKFVGWNTDKDAKVGLTSYQMPASEVTLYAIYSKDLTATYQKGSNVAEIGKTSDKCTIYNNESTCKVTLPSISANTGYTVDGWYNGNNKVGNANAEYSLTENVTLTSKVTQNQYTVTYNYSQNGGTSATKTSAVVGYGDNIDLTPTATKEGWTFVGWNTNKAATSKLSSLKMGTSNVTLYAIYRKEAKTVTITFNKNGATSQTPSGGSANTNNTLTQSCTIPAVYNNATQATSCKITSPKINASSNTPTVIGYNTSASATTSTWDEETEKSVSANATYYAITKKDAKKITITFNKNGAASQTPNGGSANTNDTLTQSCTINATYNGQAQATTCNITSPQINAPANTPTVVGYNTSASATSSSWNQNTVKSVSANATYYAITRKDAVTLTAKYNANGATLSSTANQTCTLAATYNGKAQATSCTVTAPSITRSGYSIIGYNTAASSQANNSSYNTETRALTLTSANNNSTWYAVTRKTVTITFDKNGASAIGATSKSCNMYNTAASCSITSPTITPATNFTVIGWSTAAGTHSNQWTPGQAKAVSANDTYYAQTQRAGRTITINFEENGASEIGAASKSCNIATVYNGASQATTCSITSPQVTAPANTPTVIGWSTAADRHSNDWSANTAKSVSANDTYYAQTKKNAVTHTVTFNNNGATLSSNKESCTIGETYNGEAQGTTCSVTSPTITPASGFAAVGFNTNKSATTSTWAQNTAKTISGNSTYYAITKSSANLTATFNANGATTIGATSLSCTRYNGATSCSVTAPSITRNTFTIIGWGESASATTAVAKVGASISLTSNKTFYALTSKTINLTYAKGANVSQIGATTGSCVIRNAATNCQVTLPSITPNTGYTSVGWNTTSGATTGTAAGAKLTVSANGKYYANALDKTAPTKPTITNSSNGNWTANNVTVTVTSTDAGSGIDRYEWYENGGWTTRALSTENGVGTITFTADRNTTIQFRAIDKAGNVSEIAKTPVKIDTKTPTVTLSTTTTTTNSITVIANASAASGISKYEYSIDGGSYVTGSGNTYTFTNVTSGNHTLSVRVTSGVGKTATTSITKSTVTLATPTFTEEGTTSKTVTIHYPAGCGSTYTCTYQKDNGTVQTVTTQTVEVEFTNSGNLKASVTDGTNTTNSTYEVKVGRTVTYNYSQNGGTSATKTSAIVEEGDAIDLTPTATKSGWTFVGWNTNKDATSKLSSLKMGTSNVTLYAIYRKEAKTVTITFNKNGATSQTPSGGSANTNNTLTQSCTIPAVYNNATQASTCNITSPKINAPANTPTVVGYNTSASATSSSWNQNTAKGVSANATYYAITRKDAVTLTAKYNANGATLSSTANQTCTLAATYNGKAQATSCTVTAPSITRSGYTIIGYNTAASSQANNSSYNTETRALTLTSANNNSTWYAVTRKTVTITFDKNGASAIGATSKSCNMYNTAASCSITSPTITPASNFTVIGWSTAAGTHSNQWSANTAKSVSANDTYYAQTQRAGKTITITFNKNGAASQTPSGGSANTNDTLTQSCNIATVYNGASQATTCNITSPKINPASGFTVIGYNTSANTHTSSWNQNTSKAVSGNATYYAQTQKAGKTITINFEENGAAAVGATSQSCNIATVYNGASQATTCNITSPKITPATNFTVIGWSTAAGTHSNQWTPGQAKAVSANDTYYAQTQRAGRTITINFEENGASEIGAASKSCNIATVYNGASQATTCSITSPQVTASSNTPTVIGWSTAADRHQNDWSANTAKSVSANDTYYAQTTKGAVTRTITFNKNGAASQTPSGGSANTNNTLTKSCTIAATYNGTAQGTTCNITSPKINASSNTPTVVGYNTSASATSSSWNQNTAKGVSANATYYAITRKDAVTLTAKYNANGATLSSTANQTCTLAATYNGKAQKTSCTVTAPSITRSGYSIIGYNTSASSQTNNSSYNTETRALTLTSANNNSTWYAVTKKTVTITFDKNGASAIGATSKTCNMYNTAASCSITSPTITPASNFTVIGWSTAAGTHSNQWSANTAKSVSANDTYYAQTQRAGKTITITFNKNGAASQTPSGGSANTNDTLTQSCNIATVYNGASQATTCNITSPKINASANTPTVIGYNTSASGTTSAWNQSTSKAVSANATYYAITRKNAKTITVTFNKNGAASQTPSGGSANTNATLTQNCTIAATYNGKAQATTCNITSPKINPASGFTVIGYNTSAGATTSAWTHNTAKAFSSNATYYAITRSSSQYTATFNANGATSIGATSLSCYRYNGASSCSITTPTITRSGFTITGWGTSAGATTAAVGANANLALTRNATYYAVTSKTVTVSYTKGTNVSAIGATSNTCTIRNTATNCQVTLPSITAASTYVADGWYNGTTKAGNAGAKYTVSNNVSLTSKAIADTVTATVSASNKTTNSITAVANASATSGISKYEFSINDGDWVDNGTNKTYKFTGLADGTNYSIKVRVTAASGKKVTSSAISVTTNTVPIPTFTQSGVYPITVRITFPEGCGSTYTCTYTKNNGTAVNVTTTTVDVTFNLADVNDNYQGSVAATVSDGTNTQSPAAHTVKIQLKAADLSYTNTATGLDCTDAQCALDAIKRMLE